MNNPLQKLRVIAKAKFSDKSNLGDWYQDRLSICEQCPLNSKNTKPSTAKEIAIVTANLGKPSCYACGCEVAAKASVREEQCGLVKIGQEPLWEALPEIDSANMGDFYIENLSSHKVQMTVHGNIILDYGRIRYASDTHIEVSLKDKLQKTTNMRALSSCGCTVPVPRKIGETYFIGITYDSKRKGKFEKNVTLRITRDGKLKNIQIKILGTVI